MTVSLIQKEVKFLKERNINHEIRMEFLMLIFVLTWGKKSGLLFFNGKVKAINLSVII